MATCTERVIGGETHPSRPDISERAKAHVTTWSCGCFGVTYFDVASRAEWEEPLPKSKKCRQENHFYSHKDPDGVLRQPPQPWPEI